MNKKQGIKHRKKTLEPPRSLLHISGFPPPFRDIHETRHPVGWTMNVYHKHDFWQIVLNISGTGKVKAKTSLLLDQGDSVILPPGIEHTWSNAGDLPLDLLNIHIHRRQPSFIALDNYFQALCSNASRMGVCPKQPDILYTTEKLFAELKTNQYGCKLICAALLMELVVAMLRNGLRKKFTQTDAAHPVSRIEKAMWFIEANYAQPISLRDISRVLGVSPGHACDLFKSEIGISPLRCLRKVRIQKAKFLLEDTLLSVKEIAASIGFSDEHYFSRLFRNMTGESPLRHRLSLIPKTTRGGAPAQKKLS